MFFGYKLLLIKCLDIFYIAAIELVSGTNSFTLVGVVLSFGSFLGKKDGELF